MQQQGQLSEQTKMLVVRFIRFGQHQIDLNTSGKSDIIHLMQYTLHENKHNTLMEMLFP